MILSDRRRLRPPLNCRASGFVQSSKSICKEIALQQPKAGKFDYLSAPGHSAHSMASEFFTDDQVPQNGHSARFKHCAMRSTIRGPRVTQDAFGLRTVDRDPVSMVGMERTLIRTDG